MRALAAAMCLLSLASCTKFLTGKSIKVRATSHAESASTKTAYSGEKAGDFERIDWVAGDKVQLIMSYEGLVGDPVQKTYQIEEISARNRNSLAKLELYGSTDELEWGGEVPHDFWAAYPSTLTIGDHTVSAGIPATQTVTYQTENDGVLYYTSDMSKAYMVAGLHLDEPASNGIVDLDFYPAVTTFDFTVGANGKVVIKSFVMETTTSGLSEDVALSGTAVTTFGSGMTPSFSSPESGQSITASFAGGFPSISQTKSVNFKLFALPLPITGVRIRFTIEDNAGVESTLSLNLKKNDNWIPFPARVKANISGLLIPGAVWKITFEGPYEEKWTDQVPVEIAVE